MVPSPPWGMGQAGGVGGWGQDVWRGDRAGGSTLSRAKPSPELCTHHSWCLSEHGVCPESCAELEKLVVG